MSDISIVKLAIEATFKPSLIYYSKQGDIGNKVWETIYPHWETNGLKIIFSDIENKEIGLINHVQVLVVKEDVDSVSLTKTFEHFSKIYRAYVEGLPESSLERIGMRVIGFYNPGMDFSEIAKIMQPKVYPSNGSDLYKVTAKNYEDVAFTAMYKNEKNSIRFQAGPVNRDELIQRFQPKYLIKPSELPESSLYLDVDCFQTKPSKEPDKIDTFLESIDTLEKNINSFVKYIFENK